MENTQNRFEEYKVELVNLSNKFEVDLVAVPTFINSDNAFKVGATINIIDKKSYDKIQEVSKQNTKEVKSEQKGS